LPSSRVSLVAVRAYEGGLLVGKPIKDMREPCCRLIWMARIAAIFRRDQPVFPEGDTVIEAGDEVSCSRLPNIFVRFCASCVG
jgi:trk system potassium uptake protein TrkA